MTDVAQLGIAIDSGPVKQGAAALDQLTAAGQRAETQTAKLGVTFKQSGTSLKDLLANENLSVAAKQRLSDQLAKQGIALNTVSAATGKMRTAQASAVQGSMQLSQASGILAQSQDKSSDAATRFVDTLTRRFLLGFAIAQVRGLVTALVDLNGEAARAGDIGKLTGIGSGGIQGIISAAGAKGVGGDTIAGALVAFNQQIPLAKAGIGSLGELLKANKITVSDTGDAFVKVAELVKNAATDTERLSILQQAGLPATQEMVRLMSQGAAGIKDAVDQTSKLSDKQIQTAQKVRDEWYKTWQQFKDEATKATADSLSEIAKAIIAAKQLATIGALAISGTSNRGIALSVFGSQLSQRDANSFYDATGADRGKSTTDEATRKAIEMAAIQRQQTMLGLLGDTQTVDQKLLALTLQIKAAESDPNAIRLTDAQRENLERLTKERALGIDRIKLQTDALGVEAQTYGMSTGQAAAFAAVQNQINDANRRGVPLTQDQIAAIQQYANTLGSATQNMQNLKDAGDLTSGFLKDFKNALMEGKTAWQAFGTAAANVLNKIADILIDMAVKKLMAGAFGNLFGGFNFGGPTSISPGYAGSGYMGQIYHDGGIAGSPKSSRYIHPAYYENAPRYHNGGIAGLMPGEIPAILKKGEPVFKSMDDARQMLGGGVSVHTGDTTIIVQGDANEKTLGIMRDELAKRDQALPGRVIDTYRQAKSRRIIN